MFLYFKELIFAFWIKAEKKATKRQIIFGTSLVRVASCCICLLMFGANLANPMAPSRIKVGLR